MTKVEVINNIMKCDPQYHTIRGRLYAKDSATLHEMLYKLVKQCSIAQEVTCPGCGYKDLYQPDEFSKDIYGPYVVCHKCGGRVH